MNSKKNKNLIIALVVLMLILLVEAMVMIAISRNRSDDVAEVIESVQEDLKTELPEPTKSPVILSSPIPNVTPEDNFSPKPTETPEPTDTPEPTPTEIPLNGYKVAIDAGHQLRGDSGLEPIGPGSSQKKAKVSDGTSGVSTGVPEYQLNLMIAKKLKKVLRKRGYQVYMIRSKNDVSISNVERAKAANDSGADVYIRLHADGVEDSSANGASALYPTTDNPYVSYLSPESKRLSECVINAYCERTGIENRGLSKRDDLTGTNWSEIPVTLLEMGFMSNPSEDQLMQDRIMQRKMAIGIANGIDQYFE